MCLKNTAAYIPINQALWRTGAAAHPVSGTTPTKELVADNNDNDYPLILLTSEQAKEFALKTNLASKPLPLKTLPELVVFYKNNLPKRSSTITEETIGLILNTSGTTGKPKQVGLTHKMMRNAAQYNMDSHKFTSNDTVLLVMPMFHMNAQMIQTTTTILAGGRIVVAPKFSASRYWDWVSESEATWSSVVPTIVTILLKNENALNSFKRHTNNIHLRFIRCASAVLSVSRHRQFLDTYHIPLLEGYGMTEACSQCTLNPLDAIKVGSAGKPYHTEMAIYTGDTYTTEANVKGEIVIRGDHVITHYLRGSQKDFYDNWFHTGDLGYFDKDHYLWMDGRIKHVINHGGEKVSPVLVETTIAELDFIKNVAVVPTPDEIYGEAVTAAVILDDPKMDQQEAKQKIIDYCKGKLALYRCPTKVFFIDKFPLNPTGKILRAKLSDELTKMEEASHASE